MAIEFVEIEEAKARSGVRLVVVGGVPSPWSEAVKGLLHVKGLPYCAVRLDQANPAFKSWTRHDNAPVLMIDDEAPLARWNDILLRLERLSPAVPLLPAAAGDRALLFGLAHEICGEDGLGWTRRVQLVDAGLTGNGGFSGRIAGYLAKKYGHSAATAAAAPARVADVLRLLTARLSAQQGAGSPYFIGDRLTALDIYGATFMALFRPLDATLCPMADGVRRAFETPHPTIDAALAPILLDHRDLIYARHLERPLAL